MYIFVNLHFYDLHSPFRHTFYILHRVCTASLVLSFVSLTKPAIVLNLHQNCKRNPNPFIVRMNQEKYLLRNPRIPHTLIQETLARSDDRALRPQPLQSDRPLPRIATTHPIHKHIDPMSLTQQIQRRLRHTNMRLDTHNSNLILLIGVRLQRKSQVRHEH